MIGSTGILGSPSNDGSIITDLSGSAKMSMGASSASGIAYNRVYLYSADKASYANYDAYWLLFNTDHYDYMPPENPIYFQELDMSGVSNETKWGYYLKYPNAFGNYNRWTDINGDDPFEKTYVIDHLTGLGFGAQSVTSANGAVHGSTDWRTALSECYNSTFLGWSDWRLPNYSEVMSASIFDQTYHMRYWYSASGIKSWWINSMTPTGGFTWAVNFNYYVGYPMFLRQSWGSTKDYFMVRNHYL